MENRCRAKRALVSESPWLTVPIGLGSSFIPLEYASAQIRFESPVVYAESGGSRYLASGDLNGDALPDFSLGVSNGIELFFGTRDGSLVREATIATGRPVASLTAGDVDGDGHVDIVWYGQLEDLTRVIQVWFNDGSGRAGAIVTTQIPGRVTLSPILADANGDGHLEIVTSWSDRTLSALINDGGREFALRDLFTYHRSDYPIQAVTAGDFDGDGDTDFAALYQYTYSNRDTDVKGTYLALLVNDSFAGITMRSEMEVPWQELDYVAGPIASGDLDNDGDLDVIASANEWNERTYPVELLFAKNEEGQAFEVGGTWHAGGGTPQAVQVSDLDTDGRLDVLFSTSDVNGVYVVRNLDGRRFEGGPPFLTSPSVPQSLAIEDLSRDGLFDVVAVNADGMSVLVNKSHSLGLELRHSRVIRGRRTHLVCIGGMAGDRVHFLASRAGLGSTVGISQLGGLILDLQSPVQVIGVAVCDESGRAAMSVQVPPGAEPGVISMQAVIRREGSESSKSVFRTAVVE